MNDDVKQRRTNESLQDGEGKPAYGEDARDFGEGRQKDERAFEPGHNDAKDRELGRDPTVPPGEHSSRSEQ